MSDRRRGAVCEGGDRVGALHPVFSLRSRAVGPPDATRSELRQLVDLCPANGPGGRFVQRLVRLAVSVVGARALPTAPWPLPVEAHRWEEIAADVVKVLGIGAGDERFLWHLPPPDQPQTKFGAVHLGADGEADAFVRVVLGRPLPAVAPVVAVGPESGVAFPVRLATRVHGDAEVEVAATVLRGPHHAVELGLERLLALTRDVEVALAPSSPPPGTPPHWRPMHGDLTPWNLRRSRHGTALVDWEAAGWGPPHADLVRYLVTSRRTGDLVRRLPSALLDELVEAARSWGIDEAPSAPMPAGPRWVRRAVARQHASRRALADALGFADRRR